MAWYDGIVDFAGGVTSQLKEGVSNVTGSTIDKWLGSDGGATAQSKEDLERARIKLENEKIALENAVTKASLPKTGQTMQPVTIMGQSFDRSKIMLYGGIALAGIVVVMVIAKRRGK